MTKSKLLEIAEDIKNLSTSGNKIQVEEYKNGKKVEKKPVPTMGSWKEKKSGPMGRGPMSPADRATKKKKFPIVVITNGSTNGYKIILTKPKKKNKNYSNQ